MNERADERGFDRLLNIPRLDFGHYPTPIEELKGLRSFLIDEYGACPGIFIKRDDYTGPGFGGNKVRKLEYVLSGAVEAGIDVVITTGSVKSNHARVTAAFCAKLGIRCILVLNQAAVMYEGLDPASLHLDRLYGAEIIGVDHRDDRDRKMEDLAGKFREEGLSVKVIPLGASVPLGALGFVRALDETRKQVESMGIAIDYLFHCSSSGGTQAGLVSGRRMMSWADLRIIGVSPDEPSESVRAEVSQIIGGIEKLLQIQRTEAPVDSDITVLDQYIGPGYGIPTPESKRAIEILARTEGVILDPVYTSKAMAGLIDWIGQGRFSGNDNVLFWHTGGQMALYYSPSESYLNHG